MLKTFYLQVDNNDFIRDCIEYQHDDYKQIELNTPLPVGLIGGWFKFENGQIVEHPELKPLPEPDYTDLDLRITETELAVDYRLSMLELGLV